MRRKKCIKEHQIPKKSSFQCLTLFLVHTAKMFFVYYDCYLLCCKLKDRQQHKHITFIATQVTAESSNVQTWTYRALHLQDYKHSTMSLVVFLEHSLTCTQGKETRPHVHTNILRLLNYAGTKVEHIQTLWAATMWLGLTSTNQVRRNSGVTVTSAQQALQTLQFLETLQLQQKWPSPSLSPAK